MSHQDSGQAIRMASRTGRRKSRDSKAPMEPVDAPNTFRIPISFTRCCAEKVARAKSPRQAITIVIPVKMLNMAAKPVFRLDV